MTGGDRVRLVPAFHAALRRGRTECGRKRVLPGPHRRAGDPGGPADLSAGQLLPGGSGAAFEYRRRRAAVPGDRRGAVCAAGEPGRDPLRGSVELRVEQTGDTAYQVNAAVELLDEDKEVSGVEYWSFPYEWVDERWVFTRFQLVY